MQWGLGVERYCGVSNGSNEVYTDTFGMVFPTACLWMVTGLHSPGAADKNKLTNCTTVTIGWTAANFTWGLDQVHDAQAVYANVSYLAIGY
ncbi:hypothetical protein SDC9_144202 [bioreactor metagenome]|uniref:Putative tail fiber protein gp53-like C-terminal domain-containing protein n=1 Tax=bioreactor metagenome TaxID=1076179 RepID=A0A645E645_9ZZZZ